MKIRFIEVKMGCEHFINLESTSTYISTFVKSQFESTSAKSIRRYVWVFRNEGFNNLSSQMDWQACLDPKPEFSFSLASAQLMASLKSKVSTGCHKVGLEDTSGVSGEPRKF